MKTTSPGDPESIPRDVASTETPAALENVPRRVNGAVENVFAVVEQDQPLLVRQVAGEHLLERASPARNPHTSAISPSTRPGSDTPASFHQPHPVGESVGDPSSDLLAEPRLAGPTDPGRA